MRRYLLIIPAVLIVTAATSAQNRVVSDAETYANPVLYAARKAEWLARVEMMPSNVDVLEAAADFFLIRERSLAQELYERARALEPNDPRWLQKLAQLHRLNATNGNVAEAQLALAALEQARAMTQATEQSLPTQLPMAAFDAGDLVKARAYATQLLETANTSPRSWDYGNAIHQANIVLGRIAVKEGRFADAANFLLSAGGTPGSPQLDSFGPNLSLARDLLERGETSSVLKFFELCGKFWKMGGDRLATWAAEVQAGRVPQFGANLRY
jgi:tetratricopeptide (TPR) repeat protein